MDESVKIDEFHVDSLGLGVSHAEIRGSKHLRVLFLRDGGRKPQLGFEVSFPMSASDLADHLERTAKSLREAR